MNVINWFAANLVAAGSDGKTPTVSFGMNMTCVAKVVAALRQRKLQTTHILTVCCR